MSIYATAYATELPSIGYIPKIINRIPALAVHASSEGFHPTGRKSIRPGPDGLRCRA